MNKSILGIALLLLTGVANATDYKTLLNGKTMYMKGGTCAGLSLAKNSGLMGNQSPCKIVKYGLDGITFLMKTPPILLNKKFP